MSSPPGPGSPGPPYAPDDLELAALLPLFVVESQERLARMELALLTLEEQPGDRDALDEVFRVVHTIKGDAATVGMRDLADFSHRVEDTLDLLRAGTHRMSSQLATFLLRAVDVLRDLVGEAAGGAQRRRDDLAGVLDGVAARLGEAEPDAGATSAPRPGAAFRAAAAELGPGTLRVEVARLDELLTVTGELVAARSQLVAHLEAGDHPRAETLELVRSSERLYLELQELAMKLRMVAVGPTLRRFQRMVRDQALVLGKEAVLELDGTEVELDNSVLQRLRDPLSHLLRNALAHGLETPEERRGLGKEPVGRILMRARREGGGITIEVVDDGRGLDREAIVGRARQLGLVPADHDLGDQEALQLAFAPGLSTARAVSDAAGRGVGLDVVKRTVEGLRGRVEATSRPGDGTTIAIRLPLTLAVIDALHVRVADQVFVIALDVVHEVVELPRGILGVDQPTALIALRDHGLTCARLSSLLGLVGDAGRAASRQNVVVVRLGELELGLAVDEVLGRGQTLIKPLPRMLRRAPGFSGLAALGDGGLALILDLPELLRHRGLTTAVVSNPDGAGGTSVAGAGP
jgi:two-component system, chemotaxis family, sensor kinase CheA